MTKFETILRLNYEISDLIHKLAKKSAPKRSGTPQSSYQPFGDETGREHPTQEDHGPPNCYCGEPDLMEVRKRLLRFTSIAGVFWLPNG